MTIEGFYDPSPEHLYLALLESVRDFPGQYVDRTIAIWRMRQRRKMTWRDIGELFVLSAERCRQIAKSYSPGNYCALMAEGVQCGKPSVRVFDWPIANMTAKVGFCAEHVEEHGAVPWKAAVEQMVNNG